MSKKRSKPGLRKPRTDAQCNRERILGIAKDAFTRSGVNLSLDDVAKRAGIGVGTLYRHFPTRDVLLEAVYRSEVERLAPRNSNSPKPCLLLRHCERRCCSSLTTLRRSRSSHLLQTQLLGDLRNCLKQLRSRSKGPINARVERAIESGDVRPDLDPLDLLRALIGVSKRGIRARLGAER
jgi:AcrR family transcriptional regulator